ncbi:hypothetical protein FB451DRAFT_1293221 [Mycena latifolia]|nr:hypothetical protein FB451DRAFT_1293221 [Mycena latifolia]
MSTAKVTVMSTPELLELTLPMRDLLVTAPLVCKMWQAMTLSPSLQRALFFQPDPSSECIQNPLLAELFPPFFAPESPNGRSQLGNAKAIMAMPWSKAPDAFKREDASWRRMLVTQPPAQTMIITKTRHTRGGNFKHRVVLKDLSLRMSTLYDTAVPLINRAASSFLICWHGDDNSEGDLTLAVASTVQCVRRLSSPLAKQFYSDGHKSLEFKFEEC